MTEPTPLVFQEEWALRDFAGAPLVETVLSAFVGRCQECGRDAEEQSEGSVLVNPLHIEGVLYGDTFCVGCFDEESTDLAFVLEPSAASEEDERLA
jgi:hypothetical protein